MYLLVYRSLIQNIMSLDWCATHSRACRCVRVYLYVRLFSLNSCCRRVFSVSSSFLSLAFIFFHTQTELLSISIAWNAVLTVFAIQFNTRSHLKSIKKIISVLFRTIFFVATHQKRIQRVQFTINETAFAKRFVSYFVRSFLSTIYLLQYIHQPVQPFVSSSL